MALMDLYCQKSSLQFDKKIIFNMDLNNVHKEKIDIKEELTDSSLKEESEVRTRAPIRCEICGKSFSFMGNMKKHVESAHENKKQFSCEICDYSFCQKSHLATHVASLHEGKKPFKCEICDYSFSRKGSMKIHVLSVHEKKKQFKCEICDYRGV